MSNIPLGFPFGFFVADDTPLDGKYGTFDVGGWRPYVDEAEALAAIPIGIRHIGLTVNINGVEWWFSPGTTDGDLVIKSPGGSGDFWPLDGYGELTNDVEINGVVSFGVDFSSLSLFNLESDQIDIEAVIGGISITSAASIGVESDSFSFESQSTGSFEADEILLVGNDFQIAELDEDDTWNGVRYLVPPSNVLPNTLVWADWVQDEIAAASSGWAVTGTTNLTGDVIIDGGGSDLTLLDLTSFNMTADGNWSMISTDGSSLSTFAGEPLTTYLQSLYNSAPTRIAKVTTAADNNNLYVKLSTFETADSSLTVFKNEILGDSRRIRLKNRSGLSAVYINYLGSIDPDFATGAGANANINVILKLPDGKFLIGGGFSTFDGVSRNRIARINANGTLDTSFDPGTGFNNTVTGIVRQSDGKFVVTGAFTSFNSVTGKNRIVRLNTDGTIDGSYTPGTGFATGTQIYTVIQSDDKVIAIGGGNYNGTSGLGLIVRINTDGTRDATFATGAGFNSTASAIKMQPDGKILVGGSFTTFKGVAQNRLVRIDSSGNVDATLVMGTGFNANQVVGIDIYPDGRIIAVGSFTSYNGNAAVRIVRMSSTGTYDATLVTGAGFTDGTPALVSIGADNEEKIYVAGNYEAFDGVPQYKFLRLNSSGSKDTTFDITDRPVGTSGGIGSMVVLSDGQVVVGGNFSDWDGSTKGSIVKVTVRSEVRVYGDLLGVNIDRSKYNEFSYVDKGFIASKILTGSATLDFGSTPAQNSTDLTITVTGAAIGDAVSLAVPTASILANSSYTAWVSATNTVTVRFNNYSSGALDPASGTFTATVVKSI